MKRQTRHAATHATNKLLVATEQDGECRIYTYSQGEAYESMLGYILDKLRQEVETPGDMSELLW